MLVMKVRLLVLLVGVVGLVGLFCVLCRIFVWKSYVELMFGFWIKLFMILLNIGGLNVYLWWYKGCYVVFVGVVCVLLLL